jgi:hypothetical protein
LQDKSESGASAFCYRARFRPRKTPSVQTYKRQERPSEGKKAGHVRTGLRRRVLAEPYQMLETGEYHYDMDARNHETKMARYR